MPLYIFSASDVTKVLSCSESVIWGCPKSYSMLSVSWLYLRWFRRWARKSARNSYASCPLLDCRRNRESYPRWLGEVREPLLEGCSDWLTWIRKRAGSVWCRRTGCLGAPAQRVEVRMYCGRSNQRSNNLQRKVSTPVHVPQKMSFRFRLKQGTFLELNYRMYIWLLPSLSWLYMPTKYVRSQHNQIE